MHRHLKRITALYALPGIILLLIACAPGEALQVFVTPTPAAADMLTTNGPVMTNTPPTTPAETVTRAATLTPTHTQTPAATPTFTRTPAIPTPLRPVASREPAETSPPAQPTQPLTPTPEDWTGPYTFPEGVNPLTGLAADDPAALGLRPAAVKISNAPPLVRPQHGIGQADVVFEHYAEGGLTRFTAVFLSQLPRRVGSIRSARLIDVEIPEMFESYLVYSGSSQGVRERIEASGFAERAFYGVETGPPAYYRDISAAPAPHNLFADLVAIHDLAAARGVNSPPAPEYSALAFSPQPVSEGEPAETLNLRYRGTRVRWQYDEERGIYLRWSDNLPHFDAALERQVSAANVVVLLANHVEDVTVIEGEYEAGVTYSIEIQLWGEGRALYFRDGQHWEGTWTRPDPLDMFGLYDAEGEVMRLKPGVTFFQLVPLEEENSELAVEITIE